MKNKLIKISCPFALIVMLLTTSCSDFISIDNPQTEIVKSTVFESDGGAITAVKGIYSLMMTNSSFTWAGMEEYTGIASDELIGYSVRVNQLQFFQNALSAKNTEVLAQFWTQPYLYINNANAIIEGVAASTGMTEAGKKQVEGEARFIRAFCHFYLTNLFGPVPYVTSTDYKVTSMASRDAQEYIYQLLEEDLLDAISKLSSDFKASDNERIQPNKIAAMALLARVYLYEKKYDKAEAMSTEVINSTTDYSLLANLDQVFLANSREAIWQLKPVIPGANTPMGPLFIITNTPNGTTRRVSMTSQLSAAFEPNDQRKSKWTKNFTNTVGSWNYIYKYKIGYNNVVTEYSMVLRLAEQYLIRAESRTWLSKLADAKADLNIIRNRAGLPNTLAGDQTSLLAAVEQERRVEFFGECGHRWLDLKRTDRINPVLTQVKPGWQPTDALFPIPDSERLLNPALSQNDGY